MKDNERLQMGGPSGASVQCPAPPRHRILVVAAEDGAAGWEAVQDNNYNLLITEYSLPRLTGIELVRKLRAARMAVPVVMTAVRMPVQELARDPSLQLAAVLPKPFYISELLETVKAVLRATDSLREQLVPLPNWQSQPSAVGLRL
jgi:DNA-binding response OmpR family regulator